jgi:hypothetical protein
MVKRLAILQSNYIPWKGYFDLIAGVDEFILFDDVQYTRRDWRNRNQIKTPRGREWLSIPVKVKGKFEQSIRETEISDPAWAESHWKALQHNYAQAPHFKSQAGPFKALYENLASNSLSQVNWHFITAICQFLGLQTQISWSMDYQVKEGKTERLISLCQQAGAGYYLSGPSAQTYIDPAAFAQAGIELAYMDYSNYPPYHQLYPPFEHGVSILDLIFNEGPQAAHYMKNVAHPV